MTDQGETFLPTHVEAMRKAVREAERGNAQMANAWVRIASELREGSVPPVTGVPRRPTEDEYASLPILDINTITGDNDDAPPLPSESWGLKGGDALESVETVMGRLSEGATQMIPKVIETGHRVDCVNCGLGIYWTMTADGPEGHPIWLHNITHQHLCPRDESYKGSHTFAAPSGE